MKRTHMLCTRVDDAFLEQLDREAARLDRDRAWLIRAALVAFLRSAGAPSAAQESACLHSNAAAPVAPVNLARARDSRTKDDTP